MSLPLLSFLNALPLPDPATYQATGWLSVVLFSLAGGTNQLLKLLDRLRPKPAEQCEVRLLDDPATRVDLGGVTARFHEQVTRLDHEAQAHKAENDRQFAAARQEVSGVVQRIDAAVVHLDQRRSSSIGRLHEQLARAEAGLAAVKKEAEIHTQQLAQLDVKITLLLQRPVPRAR